jgi:integrase
LLALEFILLTAQRPSEVASAKWSEINFEFKMWTIPPEKTKNGLTQRVPLSPQAIAILNKARSLNTESEYVFSWPQDARLSKTRGQPINHYNIARVARNLLALGGEPWHPHDLRRTTATKITELDFERVVVQKILNHADREITAVYDRNRYDGKKRLALEAWGNKVDELRAAGLLVVAGETVAKETEKKAPALRRGKKEAAK